MACPYFIPDQPHPDELWKHRHRLPLGDGFAGHCGLPEASPCSDETLRLQCNLGYAKCPYLPVDRAFDAVRFLVQDQGGGVLQLQFACELAHLPALTGSLRYDQSSMEWLDVLDPRLERLARAVVRGWINRNADRIHS